MAEEQQAHIVFGDYFDKFKTDSGCKNTDLRDRDCGKCLRCQKIAEEYERIQNDIEGSAELIMEEDYPGMDIDDLDKKEGLALLNEIYTVAMNRHRTRMEGYVKNGMKEINRLRRDAIRKRLQLQQQERERKANSISFMDIYETIQEGYNEWNQNEANRAIRDAFKK